MKYFLMVCIALSVNQVIAQENNVVKTESNAERQIKELKLELSSLLENQTQLISQFEAYRESNALKVSELQGQIKANVSQTNGVERQLKKNIKESTIANNRQNVSLKEQQRLVKENLVAYKSSSDIKIQELQGLANKNTNLDATNLDATKTLIDEKVGVVAKEAREGISMLSKKNNEKMLYWVLALLVVAIFSTILFVLMRKQISNNEESVSKRLQETSDSLKAEQVSLDRKLIEIIESQLSILKNKDANKEEDHSLALKVADEIVRIRKNTSRMDKSIKGLKQLLASVTRIQDNFSANGYEIVEMLGRQFDEGMKASVNFVIDEELEPEQSIISKIIKPQVNYQGVMIQSAQIEVNIGE